MCVRVRQVSEYGYPHQRAGEDFSSFSVIKNRLARIFVLKLGWRGFLYAIMPKKIGWRVICLH